MIDLRKPKVFRYPKSISFIINERAMQFVTNLYEVGVYGCLYQDNKPVHQANWHPRQIADFARRCKKDYQIGVIDDLIIGETISVIEDAEGFWTEVKSKKDEQV